MDIQKLMEQAERMQRELANMEAELDETIYKGNSGGEEGVTITINGRYEVQGVEIADDLMDPENKEMLQDMILLAMNAAVENAANDRESRLGDATSGLNLPELG
jgi:DNA-binding YbaB/EbfC family protein